MPRYLLVAHQTASSKEVIQAVKGIVDQSPDAEFVLLVPETPLEDLLDWQEGDSNLHDWCWVAPGAEKAMTKALEAALRKP